jgi:hypothetical protein
VTVTQPLAPAKGLAARSQTGSVRATLPTRQEQETAMKVEPRKEHEWLQRLVGEWSYEAEASMGPGQPPSKARGSERVRSVGGVWIVAEGEGEMPGGAPATTVMTLGYDPQRERFVGTWIGSMMTHLWVYDGALDAAGEVLTLDNEGPSMTGDGTLAEYQDVVEVVSDDHRVLRSRVLAEGGQWREFMMAHYRRTGAMLGGSAR